jgi:hypothetical protein
VPALFSDSFTQRNRRQMFGLPSKTCDSALPACQDWQHPPCCQPLESVLNALSKPIASTSLCTADDIMADDDDGMADAKPFTPFTNAHGISSNINALYCGTEGSLLRALGSAPLLIRHRLLRDELLRLWEWADGRMQLAAASDAASAVDRRQDVLTVHTQRSPRPSAPPYLVHHAAMPPLHSRCAQLAPQSQQSPGASLCAAPPCFRRPAPQRIMASSESPMTHAAAVRATAAAAAGPLPAAAASSFKQNIFWDDQVHS